MRQVFCVSWTESYSKCASECFIFSDIRPLHLSREAKLPWGWPKNVTFLLDIWSWSPFWLLHRHSWSSLDFVGSKFPRGRGSHLKLTRTKSRSLKILWSPWVSFSIHWLEIDFELVHEMHESTQLRWHPLLRKGRWVQKHDKGIQRDQKRFKMC